MIRAGRNLVRIVSDVFGDQDVHVGPASYDISLGPVIYEGNKRSKVFIGDDGKVYYEGFKLHELEEGDVFTFRPGRLYIASSKEYVRMPNNAAGLLFLRSSAGRRGLDHLHAGYIDPGFQGTITFELTAAVPTEFRIGERIAQLVLIHTDFWVSYDGQYQGQEGPRLAGELVQDGKEA